MAEETSKRDLQESPNGILAFAHVRLSDVPRQPKRPPKCPQERPRGLQDGSLKAQEVPNTAPRGPQDGPGDLKGAQDGQDGPEAR
eukprot:424769-Pyramimonas_sp.AAC.1